MLRSKNTTPTRRLARVTLAGALVAVPLAALAATASAEAPVTSGTAVEVQAAPIDARQPGLDWHHRHHRGDGGWHRGPGHHPGPGGPAQFPQFPLLPPTGSG
ncbi:hypothetical protein AB0C34_08675 [Nocardia sp. NPDC049220]|uniref:hypothetical protein n=1 Tax=Nocardia sp. NPDC049220 TaxID=3155273 RepID=UPI0033E5F375